MNEIDNNNRAKGAAIIAGYLKQSVERQSPATLSEAASDFATLIAALTSPLGEVRKKAKETVRTYANDGGWKAANQAKAKAAPKEQPAKPATPVEKTPKKSTRWAVEEEERLLTAWNQDSIRDSDTVCRISEDFQRSHLAVIIRLHLMGGIEIEKGDELCRTLGTAKLLSECEAATN